MSLPNRFEFRKIKSRQSLEDLKVLIAAYEKALGYLEDLGLVNVVDEKTGEAVEDYFLTSFEIEEDDFDIEKAIALAGEEGDPLAS